jgi:hypothetical protein
VAGSRSCRRSVAEEPTHNYEREATALLYLITHLVHTASLLQRLWSFRIRGDSVIITSTASSTYHDTDRYDPCVFKFDSWDDLYAAREDLRDVNQAGNVAWAFFLSLASAGALGLPQGIPTVNTAVITFFSLARLVSPTAHRHPTVRWPRHTAKC